MSRPTPDAGSQHLPHALRTDQAVAALGSDRETGLSPDEAARRLAQFGPNALPEPHRRTPVWIFLGQFASPLIYLLFVAAGVALALGHVRDAVVIFVVVLINAVIGSIQEGRAEHSLAALRRLATHQACVVRGGASTIVAAREVVPGDILLLEAGDAVAADARLLHGAALQIAEAALTGESSPVAKDTDPLAPDTPLADRRNMVHAGTHVTAGRARAVVVATGLATEVGKIATLAESATEPKTPLERRVAEFGRLIMMIAGVLFVVVLAVGWVRGLPFGQIVMVAISQVVGMIPEGLPVAMTIALAVGVQRMARRRALVRRLPAVETLGSTTVICTDKTGTLTRNEMTVTAIVLPCGREFAVTGAGYAPEGEFVAADGRPIDPAGDADLVTLLAAATLCNDARLAGPWDDEPRWRPIGDPTEVALLVAAIKGGIVPEALHAALPRRAEIPFDPAVKMMATQHATPAGPRVVVKGAPELLLELAAAARCDGRDQPLDDAARHALAAAAAGLASRALRVLAVGQVDGAELDGHAGFAGLRGRLTILGLVGEIDPPRPGVERAVRECRAAGIRPVMVTGDHRGTGEAIARSLGIALPGDEVIDGAELERLTDAALAARVGRIAVYARVHPAQKLRIVRALQQRGEVVAMTGDGVNDAPALVQSDVGVAMGRGGTEVAREAADMILADDDFASIVAAVKEGRVVYRNIKKVILLLFSTSAAEVAVLVLAILLGYPLPFTAVQILWNNLVTESLIVVNLIMEPAEGDEMRRRPIAADEPLLTRAMRSRMALMATTIVMVTLGWFVARITAGVPEAQARTETFTLLAVCEWFNVLSCRSEHKSALALGLLRNPWLLGGLVIGNLLHVAVVFWAPLGRFFHTVPFELPIVFALGAAGSLVLWVEELRKWIVRRQGDGGAAPGKTRVARSPSGVIHVGRTSGAANSRTRSNVPARS